MEASWRLLDALGGLLGGSWTAFWRVLEALGDSWTSLGRSGRHLEGSWKHPGGSWAALGWILDAKTEEPSWAAVEAKLEVLGPTWEHLGANLGCYGANLAVMGAT